MPLDIKPGVVGKGFTPEMPTEAPPEAKAMTFSADMSLIGKDDNTTITLDSGKEVKTEPAAIKTEEVKTAPVVEATKEEAKSTTEVKPVAEKKPILTPPEGKKDEKVVTKTGEVKPVSKLITPVKDKKDDADTTDYSKFSQQDQINLKNMSRQSREAYIKLVEENRQLSSLKDSNYLQHEQGYTLSPQYQELQQKDYLARTEGRAWEQALLDIKAGKEFKDIVGFDNNNQPIYSKPRTATDRDEIRVTSNLNACIGAVRQNEQILQTYPQQFKQRIQQDMSEINQERYNRFAWVQDPKLLDYSVEVEGQGQRKISDIKNDFRNLFPPYLKNSVGVEVASDMMVAMIIQGAELREARNGQQVATIKQKEMARGEPTSDASEATPSKLKEKGVPSVFTLDGLPT